jgi:tetratricopeptide (TPR) repeat protein
MVVVAFVVTAPMRRRAWQEAERLRLEQRSADILSATAPDPLPELLQRLSKQPDDVKGLLQAASLYGQRQRYQDALFTLHVAELTAPHDADVQRALGEVYWGMRHYDKAIDAYQAALKRDDKNEETLLRLGYMYVSLGWSSQAREMLKRAREVAPRSARTFIASAMLEVQNANLSAAEEYLRQAEALQPNSDALCALKADVLNKKTKPQEALAMIDKAIALNPRHPTYHITRGDLLLSDATPANVAGAEKSYRRALELDPASVGARIGIGLCYRHKGQDDKATAELEKVVQSQGEVATAALELARLYFKRGRRTEGQRLMDSYYRGVKDGNLLKGYNLRAAMSPKDANAHFQVGKLQLKLKDYPRAIVALRRAYQLTPQNAEVGKTYANALRRVGRWDEARRVEDGKGRTE